MEMSDNFIANRMIWKAGQYRLPTSFTFLVKDLTPDIKGSLNEVINETSGTPVLFFTKPTKEWTLVCTRQVICNDNEKINRIEVRDIRSFSPTAFENYTTNKITIPDTKKSEWDEIAVIDHQSKKHILHANKGNDLFALWNILLMATRLHDSAKTTATNSEFGEMPASE